MLSVGFYSYAARAGTRLAFSRIFKVSGVDPQTKFPRTYKHSFFISLVLLSMSENTA